MPHYGKDKGMSGYKPNDEGKVADIVQADDRGASVKDRGDSLNDPSPKSDPSAGSYSGCPDPVAGVPFVGSGMEKELAEYQRKTKEDKWGGKD